MQSSTLPALYYSSCRWKGRALLLTDDQERYSGDRVWLEINALAQGYLALGMNKGDVVGFLCASSVKQALAYFACQLIGAVPCCMHSRETNAKLSANLEFVEASFLIADSDHIVTARALIELQGIRCQLIAIGANETGIQGTDSLSAKYLGAMVSAEIYPDDLGALLMSSGTTGHPKAVCHSHRTLVANALAGPQIYGNCSTTDSVVVIMPPSFAAWAFTVLPFLAARGRIHYGAWSSPGNFLNVLEKEQITVVPLVPTIWRTILNEPFDDRDLSCVRTAFYSGEPGSPDLVASLSETICEDVRTAYLASEIGCAAGIVANSIVLKHPGNAASTGQPVANADLRIIDPSIAELTDVPDNEVGEIVIQGESVATGYLKDEARTTKHFVDGWWRSGDLGRIDEDGFVYVNGRLDNRINTGGIKVYAEEVEAGLLRHPQIQSVAVVGEPHSHWGEQIVAHIVVANPGLSSKDIISFCREHDLLPAVKLPKEIVFHRSLPSGPTGKILRRALKAPANNKR